MNTAVTYLAQADLLLLLAEMLDNPSSWSDLRQTIGNSDADDLASATGLDPHLLAGAIGEWQAVDPDAVRVEHDRLFDGIVACPPNETIYVRRDKGAILADIAGFYRAFGFELSDAFREKHDHIVAELQFTALLLVLTGRAVETGEEESRDIARKALRSFLTDHLGVWIASFVERLEAVTILPHYGVAARLTSTAWELLRQSHDLADFKSEILSAEQQAGTPYECGMCLPKA